MFNKPIRTFDNKQDNQEDNQEDKKPTIDIVLVGTFNSKKIPKLTKAEAIKDPSGEKTGLAHSDEEAVAIFQEDCFIGYIPKAILSYFKQNSIAIISVEIVEATKYVKVRLTYEIRAK